MVPCRQWHGPRPAPETAPSRMPAAACCQAASSRGRRASAARLPSTSPMSPSSSLNLSRHCAQNT